MQFTRNIALIAIATLPFRLAATCRAGTLLVQGGSVVRCAAAPAAPTVLAPAPGLPADAPLSAWLDSGRPLLLAGFDGAGLWRSADGGAHWALVSTPGSGLEAASRRVGALFAVPTAWGSRDLLAGLTGATDGGVFLSGDAGRHWTLIQRGFDPAQLSISTLAKSSCAGCPVQYYSTSYGGGLYTRTITVSPPPRPAGACTGAACACQPAPAGPAAGGPPLTVCGTGFQTGVVIEIGGKPVPGCTRITAEKITCPAAPAGTGGAVLEVRNPDTRAGLLEKPFSFLLPPPPPPTP